MDRLALRKVHGANVCPRNKPHLRKLPSGLWQQNWPDGWKQYIAVWAGRCPLALPRYPWPATADMRYELTDKGRELLGGGE